MMFKKMYNSSISNGNAVNHQESKMIKVMYHGSADEFNQFGNY